MTASLLTAALLIALIPAAKAADACRDYAKLMGRPAISRSAIGPANMNSSDDACTCEAADPSDTKSK